LDCRTLDEVRIEPLHTIVVGMTRESGKTTCMEGFLSRWTGKKILVILLKSGENLFTRYPRIKPFIVQNTNWFPIQAMIQAELDEKNRSFRTQLMTVCADTKTYQEVWDKIKEQLEILKWKSKQKNELNIFIQLNEYFKMIIPKVNELVITASKILQLNEGIQVMDLRDVDETVQQIVVASIFNEINAGLRGISGTDFRDVVIAIPEAWKVVGDIHHPSPAKRPLERLVREGGVKGNFVVLDGQNIMGIYSHARKHFNNWIIGKTEDENDLEKTLSRLEIDTNLKNLEIEVQKLKLGQFYVISKGRVRKTFALPSWMELDVAMRCAEDENYVYTLNAEQVSQPSVSQT
jgi:hypothetical protein